MPKEKKKKEETGEETEEEIIPPKTKPTKPEPETEPDPSHKHVEDFDNITCKGCESVYNARTKEWTTVAKLPEKKKKEKLPEKKGPQSWDEFFNE